MKKILMLCAAMVTLAVIGCQNLKPSAKYSGLPQSAVDYIEKCGLGDSIMSVIHGIDHTLLYTMGFDEPAKGWSVIMSDSTQIVFSESGAWRYSVLHYNRADLSSKYLSQIENVERMLLLLRNKEGMDIRVVGVSKEKDRWIIAAYKTHDSYMGPPTYHYFGKDGHYLGSRIII